MGTLTKLPTLVAVPAVQGQEFLPSSYDCFPPPPPAPIIVPPPTGGGSGPPSGNCHTYPIYQQQMQCSGYPPDDPSARPPCSMVDVLIGYGTVCP